MKPGLKAGRLHEALYSMSVRKGRASTHDMNVARIHEGIFRMMSSMIFNPQKQDVT